MKFRKRTLYIGILMACFSALAIVNQKSSKPDTISEVSSNQAIIREQLKREEDALWVELSALGYTHEKLAQQKTEYSKDYAAAQASYIIERQSADQLASETLSAIKDAKKLTHIGQDILFIKLDADKGNPPAMMDAAAMSNKIAIVEEHFCAQPYDGQVFVLAHEMQHIRFEDDFTIFAMREHFGLEASLDNDHPFIKYRKFIEKRADFYAATSDEKLAEGYELYAITNLSNYGNHAHPTHPMSSERLLWAQEILRTVKGCKENEQVGSITPNLLEVYGTHNCNPKAVNHYQAWLSQEEAMIWDKIYSAYNINQAVITALLSPECINEFAVYTQEHTKNFASKTILQKTTIELVRSVMTTLGIEHDAIELRAWNRQSEASMFGPILFINEKLLLKHPLHTQKFIIAHELIHYVYQDLCTASILQKLILESGADAQQLEDHNHIFNEYKRFVELRADILSSLIGADYSKGNVDCVTFHLAQGQDMPALGHPSFKERLAIAQKVSQQLLA